MYTELRKRVLKANLFLQQEGLVKLTWGNVSEIDRELGVIAIKPSGVSYDVMKEADIVITDLEGNVVDGDLNPSSDLRTHVEVYRKYPEIGGITHTHSTYATAWAQAKKPIPFHGTTHADHFHGSVIVARDLTDEEINGDYERNTGLVICESLEKAGVNPIHNPAILAPNHAPFTFGTDAADSAKNSLVLEEVAKMTYLTLLINPTVEEGSQTLLDKHFNRKHGANSYYGQK
ncbi:MAG: L-ribulose-5-phosphate 4-epimerase AraD [Mycoplasmatales bacterium]